MPAQPGEVALQSRARHDEEESGFGKPRDGQVALDAAARVEHLRVDDLSGRDVHVVGAQSLQESQCVAALNPDLAEGGHVEHADAGAHGHVLVASIVEPVLPLPAIAVLALLPFAGEPVGALPAGRLAEDGATRLQVLVQRRAPHATGSCRLAVGEMVGIEQAERLDGAVVEIGPVALEGLDAADVDVPQVEGRLAILHPLRQRHAGAAGGLDADGVEAAADPEVFQVLRLAEVVAVVRSEALRTIEEGVDAGGGEQRHALHRFLKNRLEMVEILRQLVEAEILRDARHAPRLRHRLEGAEQDFPRVLLVVGALVLHAQHRQAAEVGDRFGDDIKMLAGVQRHRHAGHAADTMRPHAGAIDDVVTGDAGRLAFMLDGNAGDATVVLVDLQHLGLLDDARAVHARALGQRLGDIGRVALAVLGDEHGADHVGDFQVRVFFLGLGRRDFFDIDATGAAHRGLP